MPNLIVVSHREPYEHNSVDGRVVCQHTDGGLVSALDPILKRLGGTWVAWGSGDADREVPGQVDGLPVPPDLPAYQLRRVWLEPAVVKNGGQGYANQVLWPLCHVTLDRVYYRKAFWAGARMGGFSISDDRSSWGRASFNADVMASMVASMARAS